MKIQVLTFVKILVQLVYIYYDPKNRMENRDEHALMRNVG